MNRNSTDLLNLLSKLTFRRIRNLALVFVGYYWSRFVKKPFVPGLPVSLSIEPTTSCNLRCPECPSGLRSFTRPTGMMNPSLTNAIVDELYPDLLYLIFYFQGEPFLNPDLLKMVEYAASKKIYTATSTNAHYITPETAEKIVLSGLDRLIISLDGISQEVYQQYRKGGTLNKVLEGAQYVVEAKRKLHSKTPHTIFQFLVTGKNEHEIPLAKALANKMGVEIAFKTAQIYDYENGNPLIPTLPQYSRYKKNKSGSFEIKNTLDNHCWRLWQSSVVTWDGKVVPCCFDKDASYRLGDVTQNSFASVWKSKSYQNFRQSVLISRKETDICRNCSEGTKVWS